MFGLMPRWKERPTGALVPEALPFAAVRRELDTLFDRFFGRCALDTPELLDYPVWGLKMEEMDKEVIVRAEAPGFEVGDFEVHLVGDLLTITAAHKPAKTKEEEGKPKTRPVEMKRYVTVPPGIDPVKVEAFYRNGVLEVHLPKTAEAAGRRIEVKI